MRLLALLLLIAGCPNSIPHYDYAKEPDPRNHEVTLGVGDVLGINVWENKELNADATIRPDGSITMPLIGDVKLFRTDPKTGEIREIPLDYDELASGKHKEMNIFVLPGDSIYVP